MATFQGTVQEFHHFIGPRIKAVINRRSEHDGNKNNGVCECCYQNVMIHVLSSLSLSEGSFLCDLNTVEQAVLSAYGSINQTPKLMCDSCYSCH
ncbi:hypothetical protein [Shewanella surugensis]|uniref:Uncharacterized protein n=1 Tax=Shewanella surugensis TaxID=212020 RepID=A0ABT0L6P9_9GAMM|nr:hypothetical protein [Shewanella surugensis]MCL1123367.1 hypothetical protein [Shewanella surugensis]